MWGGLLGEEEQGKGMSLLGGSTEESAELTCGRGGFVRKKEIGREW